MVPNLSRHLFQGFTALWQYYSQQDRSPFGYCILLGIPTALMETCR